MSHRIKNITTSKIAGEFGCQLLKDTETFNGKAVAIVPNETPANISVLEYTDGSDATVDLNIAAADPLSTGPITPKWDAQKPDYQPFGKITCDGGSLWVYFDPNNNS